MDLSSPQRLFGGIKKDKLMIYEVSELSLNQTGTMINLGNPDRSSLSAGSGLNPPLRIVTFYLLISPAFKE